MKKTDQTPKRRGRARDFNGVPQAIAVIEQYLGAEAQAQATHEPLRREAARHVKSRPAALSPVDSHP